MSCLFKCIICQLFCIWKNEFFIHFRSDQCRICDRICHGNSKSILSCHVNTAFLAICYNSHQPMNFLSIFPAISKQFFHASKRRSNCKRSANTCLNRYNSLRLFAQYFRFFYKYCNSRIYLCIDRLHLIKLFIIRNHWGIGIWNSIFRIDKFSSQRFHDSSCIRSNHNSVIAVTIKYNSLCLCHFFCIEPKITNTDSTQIALELAGKWHRHHSVCPLTILNCLLSLNWCHLIFHIFLNFHTFSPSAFRFS